MKIRFLQYSENEYALQVKKWYGWKTVYRYSPVFKTLWLFKTKTEGVQYVRDSMGANPLNVSIFEYPAIVVYALPNLR